ncbi:MAG: proteasome assembly chaperone family protein [Halodesulfurarchaeum sp.]
MTDAATFQQYQKIVLEDATLIEGLPGHGLVASIAVEQIREQLELATYGTIDDETFPQVLTFEEGLAREPVRVSAGQDPPILTLQSDLAFAPPAYRPLAESVFSELGTIERAIFLAGAPAGAESERGTVTGLATTEPLRSALEEAEIDLAAQPGVIGGVTGALARAARRESIPAIVLIVRSHPYLPDPGAAQRVIEEALEPMVDFDVDTTALEKQAEAIQTRMQQIADQYEQLVEGEDRQREMRMPGMYQ